jgi:L-iditol 2-dehydrogenase
MRALVYHGRDDLRMEDRPIPTPAEGEVVIRVRACGICGTDLKIARGEHRAYPAGTVRIPGHELVGDVAAIGAGSVGAAEGDRVAVAPNIACGDCGPCRTGRPNICEHYESVGLTMDGGFAEYVRIPRRAVEQGNLLPLPSDADAAELTLFEPLAAVLRGARATATSPGDVVLVCGAGPIGLLHVMVARTRGARRIIVSEPSPARRDQALAMGATDAIDPTADDLTAAVRERSDGRGADVVIAAVPVPAVFDAAIGLAAVGGRVNFFAGLPSGRGRLELDANLIHYRELVVTGTTANTTEDCREALALLRSGAFDPSALITARHALEDGPAAFAAAAGGQAMKVVVES